MKDDLPKDEKSSVVSGQSSDDEDAPAKVSFHSLKEEASEPVEKEISKGEVGESGEKEKSLFDKPDDLKPDENSPLKEERDKDSLDDDEGEDDEDGEEDDKDDDDDKEETGESDEVNEPVNQQVSEPEQYYLQTVKVGEQPEWPRPKEDLNVFSQPLDDGLIQYWAYPKDLNKSADDLPHAEELAQKNQSDRASIVIDQICDHLNPGSCLELVLTKNGHALAKTESNLNNLEANITSILEMGRQNFGITAEHFMSTSNVSPEVEKRLDDLEEAEEKETDDLGAGKEQETPLYFNDRPAVVSENKRSKLVIFIPILILIVIFGGVVYYREKLLSKIMNKVSPPKQAAVEVTPFPTPTPTPAPSVERSDFKVRVLNGTPATGAAGVLADKLKEKGWQIDKTGNATSSAILESYVRMKTGNDLALEVLLSDVSDYQGASSSSPLKSTDKADLEFVIGRK